MWYVPLAAVAGPSGAWEAVEACIVCGEARVAPFLDLGKTALANKFLDRGQLALPEAHFPLVVGLCATCSHVQLMTRVPPSAMFEDYLYVSSASETLRRHLLDLSDVVVERCELGEGDLVVDVGCNDGTLLKGFRRHGVTALGVDPAANLARLYADPEIERYVGFFDSRAAAELRDRYGQAAVITATNTFAHTPTLRDFVAGLDTMLAPGGSFVLETHYLGDLVDQLAFDTVYHEHVSYWGLAPLCRLFEDAGMRVVHVERLPLHHGMLRAFVQRADTADVKSSVTELLAEESERGLDRLETYADFAGRTLYLKQELRRRLGELREQGRSVVGYGAPAKGNTLLSFLELGPHDLDYIVDRSPLKQGLYTPGTHIPVVSPDRLLEDQPDYVVLLAWNFADEILEQQAEYRRRGGRFILPVPEVRVVD